MFHPVLVDIAVEEVVDAGNIAVYVVCGENRQHSGYLQAGDNGEWRPRASVLKSLGGSEFHRLVFGCVYAGTVPREHYRQCSDNADQSRCLYACNGKADVPFPEQIPAAHADHEDGSCHPAAEPGVEELADCYRVEGYGPEINHLVADSVRIEFHSHRMLHPGICHENPDCGNCGSDACKPGGCEVESLADLVPSEVHHCDEGGFDEEGDDSLDGERRSENVSNEPGIIAPVGSEFKFQDETCGNTYREVDAE